MSTYAKINTKSNYRNLNGKYVLVIKFLGTIVYGSFMDEDGRYYRSDFNLSEVTEIVEINDEN